MSTPLEYYKSIPPVTKMYAVVCLMTTSAYHLQLYQLHNIALFYSLVFKRFQIWRLITSFFFLGPFSLAFAFRLLTILIYGVQVERGPFDKRTADLVWMYIFGAITLLVMGGVPYLWSPFMGASLVYLVVYVWAREFPNARVNIHNLFELKGFYMPWYMVCVDLLLGNPLKPGLVGIAAGHVYYFLSVLYPLSTGKYFLKTPLWVHKLVARWGEGFQMNSPIRRNNTDSVFRGRGRRLSGSRAAPPPAAADEIDGSSRPEQPNSGSFSGRGRRLGTH